MLDDSVVIQWLQAFAIAILVGVLIRKLLDMYQQNKETVCALKCISCKPYHWLFGHLLTIRAENSFYKYLESVQQFPKCQLLWLGPVFGYILGYHPDFMKAALNAEEPKDGFGYRFVRPWIGDGLLTSHGAKWKRTRKLLTPVFHSKSLKRFLVSMNESAAELHNIWSNKSEQNCQDGLKVEIFGDISKMTLDTILRCLLSIRSGCQSDNDHEYLKAVRDLSECVMKRLFNPFYHFDCIFHFSPVGWMYKRALKIAHRFTNSVINERRRLIRDKQNFSKPYDFLDVLLETKDYRGNGLSFHEIRDEVDTFIFEGHDTVASGIAWAMYNFAVYPKFQEECRDEALQKLHKRPVVDWADLSKLKFLTMFIKESLRLYPPVFNIGRKSSKQITFSHGFESSLFNGTDKTPQGGDISTIIPKNTNFALVIWMLHRNPNIWENPSTFNPYRFTPENSAKRSHYAYLPFSTGTRKCIGQQFAMNEMKVFLARTLIKFRIHLDEGKSKPEVDPLLVLRSKTGIHLKLERILSTKE